MLCRYANMLGKPREGAHSLRFGGVAIVDVLLTVLVAWGWARYKHARLVPVVVCLFIIGIAMHRLFCVRTTVDRALFA